MTETSTETEAVLSNAEGITERDRYRLLADGRRRIVLDLLALREEPIALEDLAAAVVDRENESGVRPRRAVRISLHHCHLPMMDRAGVVEYDPERRQVDPGPLDVELLAL